MPSLPQMLSLPSKTSRPLLPTPWDRFIPVPRNCEKCHRQMIRRVTAKNWDLGGSKIDLITRGLCDCWPCRLDNRECVNQFRSKAEYVCVRCGLVSLVDARSSVVSSFKNHLLPHVHQCPQCCRLYRIKDDTEYDKIIKYGRDPKTGERYQIAVVEAKRVPNDRPDTFTYKWLSSEAKYILKLYGIDFRTNGYRVMVRCPYRDCGRIIKGAKEGNRYRLYYYLGDGKSEWGWVTPQRTKRYAKSDEWDEEKYWTDECDEIESGERQPLPVWLKDS